MDDKVKDYIVDLVCATREPERVRPQGAGGLHRVRRLPARDHLPRRWPRGRTPSCGRGYVTPEDVKAIGIDVLRHRVVVTYEAEAEEITPEQIVQRVFDEVEVP